MVVINDVLTADDETVLIERCKSGDQDAWRELIGVYDTYLQALANRYWQRAKDYYEFDDFLAEATYGLWWGVKKFDTKKAGSRRLITYATWWIKQRLLQMRANRSVVKIPLNVSAGRKDEEFAAYSIFSLDKCMYSDSSRTYASEVEDGRESDQHIRNDEIALVHRVINAIHKEYADIIRRRLAGQTLSQIADEYGKSRQRIHQVEKLAMKKFRLKFQELITDPEYSNPCWDKLRNCACEAHSENF